MLKKLEMYGITSTELKWFSSYLRGRKQVVKFHQETSEFCDITCGVPQGLVLGPIPFLSFINDISNFTVQDCVLNMYADDVIINKTATTKDELEYRLQICIDDISSWYSMNKLCINKKKSNVMVIGSKWQLKSLNLDNFTNFTNFEWCAFIQDDKITTVTMQTKYDPIVPCAHPKVEWPLQLTFRSEVYSDLSSRFAPILNRLVSASTFCLPWPRRPSSDVIQGHVNHVIAIMALPSYTCTKFRNLHRPRTIHFS